MRNQEFSLDGFAARSFGLFLEKLFEVVRKLAPDAAKDASDFQSHPTQVQEEQKDGSLIIRFTTAGDLELVWHLYTWGNNVEVLEPKKLAEMVRSQRVSWPALP